MRFTRISLVLVGAIPCLFASTSPDFREITEPKSIASLISPGVKQVSTEDLFHAHSTGGGAWSPDGRDVVFTSDMTGRLNLWKVEGEDGEPTQLSQSEDRQTEATFSPDGSRIVYTSDVGGAESYDLFAIRREGGAPENLTNTPDVSETNPRWSPDGLRIAMGYKPKASAVTDVAVLDWKSRRVRNLTNEKAADHRWLNLCWSPNGKFIYATRVSVDWTDMAVFRLDVATGDREEMILPGGRMRSLASAVSPDGKWLLLTADRPGGYSNVALMEIATKKLTWVTDTEWEASSGDFSPDGSRFTYSVNEDGRTDVYLVTTSSLKAEKLIFPPGLNTFAGNPSAFSPDGTKLLVSHQSSTQPSNLWIYRIVAKRATHLTVSATGSLMTAKLPASQIVHYRSFDGEVISALLWVPFNLKRDGSNPGIVFPHGGPASQTVDFFNRYVIPLASAAYTVIAPNVRGSSGYGMAFQTANVKDFGGGDLEDEIYAAKFLAATGYVDDKKIGIFGGSYGGFMTLMAIGKKPDQWAAAVDLFGIIDWRTMLRHADPSQQEYIKAMLGDPERDRAIYENASPIKYLRNAKAPLLVLQGENDIHVPKEEAEQVVAIYKEIGRPIDSHFYPSEGHGFAKPENQIDAINRILAWFDLYLKAQPPSRGCRR